MHLSNLFRCLNLSQGQRQGMYLPGQCSMSLKYMYPSIKKDFLVCREAGFALSYFFKRTQIEIQGNVYILNSREFSHLAARKKMI